MAKILQNNDVSVTVEKAGDKYCGSRFDWNGLVSQIRFRGVTLLGQENPQRDPAIRGRGLHNEFGITKCIGYDDCAVGEWFPKIGTGWLRKDEEPYFFYTEYPLEELSFDCEVSGKSEVRFTCESGERNGYAYRYVKTITLADSSFTIRYAIENLGSKPLETDEYVHNFLCVGQSNQRRRPDRSAVADWRVGGGRDRVRRTRGELDAVGLRMRRTFIGMWFVHPDGRQSVGPEKRHQPGSVFRIQNRARQNHDLGAVILPLVLQCVTLETG